MTRRCYTLSTQDPEAFRRLVDAAANLGTFSVCVIEVKEPPIASKPMFQSLNPDGATPVSRAIDGAR